MSKDLRTDLMPLILLCALVAFLASLLLPSALLDRGEKIFGQNLFLIGWMGALIGMFAWYANLTAVAALTCMDFANRFLR
jgi:hypothetical protein